MRKVFKGENNKRIDTNVSYSVAWCCQFLNRDVNNGYEAAQWKSGILRLKKIRVNFQKSNIQLCLSLVAIIGLFSVSNPRCLPTYAKLANDIWIQDFHNVMPATLMENIQKFTVGHLLVTIKNALK